jgi:hypothetical protein
MRENHDDFAMAGQQASRHDRKQSGGGVISYREGADGVNGKPIGLCVPHDC